MTSFLLAHWYVVVPFFLCLSFVMATLIMAWDKHSSLSYDESAHASNFCLGFVAWPLFIFVAPFLVIKYFFENLLKISDRLSDGIAKTLKHKD